MASTECERNEEIAMQLSPEEKASIDEIIKQAEFSLEPEAAKLRPILVAGALKNLTKGPLAVMATKKYAGKIVKKFTDPLGSAGGFLMAAIFDRGVKAAVVYSGKNKAGVECGWLLAFAETKSTGKRVYVECGRKDKFNNINWAQVEEKLDNAGIIARANDKETGTSIYATIVGISGKYAVGAGFLG